MPDAASRDDGRPQATDGGAGYLRSLAGRAQSVADRARGVPSFFEERRARVAAIDVGLLLVERDRAAVGSVAGSAVAFRLFLFFVPVLLIFVAFLEFAAAGLPAAWLAEHAGVTSSATAEVDKAIDESGIDPWIALIVGAVGALWAGRSLTKVLVAVSTLAWRLEQPRRSPSLRVMGAVIGLIIAMAVAGAVVNRIRLAAGPGVATTSLLVVAVAYGVAWFVVSLVLPKATSDPSALLPGAALVGLVMGGLQWFIQFYLADKLVTASRLYGAFGLMVVTLGTLFLLGRVFVFANVIDAVIWERFGSIANFVFGLPGVRRLPARFPAVARFFDLDRAVDDHAVDAAERGGAGPKA